MKGKSEMENKIRFLCYNLCIVFISLFVLYLLIPKFIEELIDIYTFKNAQTELRNENNAIKYLNSLNNTVLTPETIMFYDKKFRTNLSAKLLTQPSYMQSPITAKQLQDIQSSNHKQIEKKSTSENWLLSFITAALIWISLTWVINNILDKIFKG